LYSAIEAICVSRARWAIAPSYVAVAALVGEIAVGNEIEIV
jgi:hypothetical protein